MSARPLPAPIPRTRLLPRPDVARLLPAASAALARPVVAGPVALVVYLLRAAFGTRLARSPEAYFNFLADAFLHGQLHLRLLPPGTLDLIYYGDRVYIYWPPFPALLLMPVVALGGVGVSDRVYTAAFAALAIGLLAQLLATLDRLGIAPLSAARRGAFVATCAFGSALLILAPAGNVWAGGAICWRGLGWPAR
jgi:hypothetical protein